MPDRALRVRISLGLGLGFGVAVRLILTPGDREGALRSLTDDLTPGVVYRSIVIICIVIVQ